jgi:hypothetical protein
MRKNAISCSICLPGRRQSFMIFHASLKAWPKEISLRGSSFATCPAIKRRIFGGRVLSDGGGRVLSDGGGRVLSDGGGIFGGNERPSVLESGGRWDIGRVLVTSAKSSKQNLSKE